MIHFFDWNTFRALNIINYIQDQDFPFEKSFSIFMELLNYKSNADWRNGTRLIASLGYRKYLKSHVGRKPPDKPHGANFKILIDAWALKADPHYMIYNQWRPRDVRTD